MTSTTTPLSDEQRLVSLEGELTVAKAELQDWSSLVKKAILGEEGHREKKEDYEKQQALWVKERDILLQQIACKCFLLLLLNNKKNWTNFGFKSLAHKCRHDFEDVDKSFIGK